MSYAATELEALYSAAIVAMACACPAWQAAVGGTVDTARAQVSEDWGGADSLNVDGTPIDQAKSWLIVRTEGVQQTPIAHQTVVHNGTAKIILRVRAVEDDLPAATVRRAKDLANALCRELRAQLGESGKLLYATFEPEATGLLEIGSAGTTTDASQLRELETTINIRWSELPL